MPGDIINLRQVRRARQKAADRVVADRNAVTHGLPKTITRLADARREKDAQRLNGKRLSREAEREE